MTTMCEVVRSVPWWLTFYDTGSINRRKSVLSLAGFTQDTKSVFKRKRNCFVAFSKRFASTHRFRIVFTRPHYNAVSVLKTLLYPQCACSNELDACAFQYLGPRNWHHSWFFVVGRCFGLEFFDIFLLNDAESSCKAGFERVVLSSLFLRLARSEALKYLVSFLWNLSDASAGLNALERASKDWKSCRSRENSHGSVCPPFWILTVEWSGTRSCLFWWRHRFQIASFSPSTLEICIFVIY